MLVLALLACGVAAGCGGDDKGGTRIPAAQAQQLLQQLDRVQARLNNGSYGACKDIFESADSANEPAVRTLLGQLPQNVDPDIRSALEQSFDRLWDLVQQKCDDRKPDAEPDTPAETTPTTPAETTPTTPTDTTATTPTTPTTPDAEPLPNDGDGTGGGAVPGTGNNGNGNGNGGGAGAGGGVTP